MSNSTAPDPMVEVRKRVSTLQSNLADVQKKALLTNVRDEAEDVETKSNRVADMARTARERGYAWEKDLEPKCLDFRKRWGDLKPDVMQAIVRETSALRVRVSQAEADVAQAAARATNSAAAQTVLPQVENELQALTSASDSAEQAVRGMFNTLSADLDALELHMHQIVWMLDQVASSKTGWHNLETPVLAIQAEWHAEGRDQPKGVLYLTDQRLVFERKEEVATKKVLFIATEKEMVQEVELEMPLAELTGTKASKQGLLGHEDHVEFEFQPGAKVRKAHFHINGQEGRLWEATVGRIKSGEMENSRITPISQEEKTRMLNAPTKCNSCGGALTAPILRGQTEIHCPYCGAVIRI
jgi:hypothetical protein